MKRQSNEIKDHMKAMKEQEADEPIHWTVWLAGIISLVVVVILGRAF